MNCEPTNEIDQSLPGNAAKHFGSRIRENSDAAVAAGPCGTSPNSHEFGYAQPQRGRRQFLIALETGAGLACAAGLPLPSLGAESSPALAKRVLLKVLSAAGNLIHDTDGRLKP
jgi:hypothetical protein